MANQKPSNRNTKVSIYTSLHLTTTTTYQYFTRIEKIRVGRDYQAVCPQLVPELDRRPELMNERALLVWSPTKEIPDMKCKCAYWRSSILVDLTWPILHSQWRNTFRWRKRNTATMANRHWACCSGTNMIWNVPSWIWPILRRSPTSGPLRIKCSSNRHFSFTAKVFIAYVKWWAERHTKSIDSWQLCNENFSFSLCVCVRMTAARQINSQFG